MNRRRGLFLIICLSLLATAAVAAIGQVSGSGHMPLHIACVHHDHGPQRSAGAGQRLQDARTLNRQARQLTP